MRENTGHTIGFNDPGDVLFLQSNEGNSNVYYIFFILLRNYHDIKNKDSTSVHTHTHTHTQKISTFVLYCLMSL